MFFNGQGFLHQSYRRLCKRTKGKANDLSTVPSLPANDAAWKKGRWNVLRKIDSF